MLDWNNQLSLAVYSDESTKVRGVIQAFTILPAIVVASLLLACYVGCSNRSSSPRTFSAAGGTVSQNMKKDEPNEHGFAKFSFREGDAYFEGVIDSNGVEIIPACQHLLVTSVSGDKALVQFERKFLFVPLEAGPYAESDFRSTDGFQYAEPYRCGVALVVTNDQWFYIDQDGNRAFESLFEFAESFHEDRALVKENGAYRIIDTSGRIVCELNYEQVSLQSPYCWQVTNRVEGQFRSGFIDLEGAPITELIFDQVGYYDPEVKRILVRRDKHFGFFNERAKVAVPLQYEYAEIFNRGKARVALGGRFFYIDPDGKEVEE